MKGWISLLYLVAINGNKNANLSEGQQFTSAVTDATDCIPERV